MAETTSQFAEELFTGMLNESGMPVTEAAMRNRWNALNAEEGSLIGNDSAYSPFWRLQTAIVTKPCVWLFRLLVRHALPNVFLRFAVGAYLDVLAWGVNVTRKGETRARGQLIFSRLSASGDVRIP